MLLAFLIAATSGIIIGYFFKVGALAIASLVLLVFAASTLGNGSALASLGYCLALLATLQTAYILGLSLNCFVQSVRRKPGRVALSRASRPITPTTNAPPPNGLEETADKEPPKFLSKPGDK